MNTNGIVPKLEKLADIDSSTILAHTAKIKATNESDGEDHKLTTKEYGNGNYLFYFDRLKINKLSYVKDEGTEKLLCNFTMDLISEHHFKVDENASPIITRVIRFSFMRQGVRRIRVEQLTHDETFNLTEFKQRINGIGQLIFYGNGNDLLELFKCLDEEQQPKIVTEFDYDGFITYNKQRYYLTNNIAFQLPEIASQDLKAFPLVEGQYFMVGSGQYISLKNGIKKTARFEPELVNAIEESGLRLNQVLLDQLSIEAAIKDYTYSLGHMVAGQSGQTAWGKALFGYMMHFPFIDLLRSPKGPQHGLFLYLYGQGNSGKGELAKIISSFFGGSTMDMHSKPTESALGTLLAQRSGRPLFIDEFKPESVLISEGSRGSSIKDQTLNSAYQFEGRSLKDTTTNQVKNEHVRTSAAFLSNYKPETDHLKSRMIILEMSISRRGEECHLSLLKEKRVELQRLFLSMMQSLPLIDQDILIRDYLQLKSVLSDLTKQKVKRQLGGKSPTILDRQVTSWAFIIGFYHHSLQAYRNKRYAATKTKPEWLDTELVELATDELMKNIVEMDDFNPMLKWIDAVAELVHQGKIKYGEHYGYAETNGEKGQKHLGLRMGRIDAIYKKEYYHMAAITRQTVESLLQDHQKASRQSKMCFTFREYSDEQRALSTKSRSWAGIKISESIAKAKDHELWEKLIQAFPEVK